jgi:hypothetical protein
MNAMRHFQFTKDKWITLILIPLKIYVVIIIPFYLIFRIILNTQSLWIKTGENAYKIDDTINILLYGYILCAPCLLIGSAFYLFAGNLKSAVQTLFVATVPTSLLLFYFFIYVIQHLL